MIRVLVAFLIVGVVALVLALPAEVRPAMQESTPAAPTVTPTPTPTPPFESVLIARANLDALPAGPATITATSVTLAPGVATQPFVNPGPTLIIVEDGSVTLDADAAVVIGVPNISVLVGLQPATPTPAAATSVVVPEDWQVLLPSGARAQLRNDTDDTVDLLLLSIVPQP